MQVLLSLRVMQVLLSVTLRGPPQGYTRIIAKLRILDSDAFCTTIWGKLSFAQGLHRDLLASTLFWSNLASQALVDRFFCDAAAMRLRFGCDAKRESLCEMIDIMALC